MYVVFEVSASAVPDQVPLEFKVIPVGNVTAVLVKAIVSPSASVPVIVVRLDAALPVFAKVPKVPLATLNVGAESTLINPVDDIPVIPVEQVNLTL